MTMIFKNIKGDVWIRDENVNIPLVKEPEGLEWFGTKNADIAMAKSDKAITVLTKECGIREPKGRPKPQWA